MATLPAGGTRCIQLGDTPRLLGARRSRVPRHDVPAVRRLAYCSGSVLFLAAKNAGPRLPALRVSLHHIHVPAGRAEGFGETCKHVAAVVRRFHRIRVVMPIAPERPGPHRISRCVDLEKKRIVESRPHRSRRTGNNEAAIFCGKHGRRRIGVRPSEGLRPYKVPIGIGLEQKHIEVSGAVRHRCPANHEAAVACFPRRGSELDIVAAERPAPFDDWRFSTRRKPDARKDQKGTHDNKARVMSHNHLRRRQAFILSMLNVYAARTQRFLRIMLRPYAAAWCIRAPSFRARCRRARDPRPVGAQAAPRSIQPAPSPTRGA